MQLIATADATSIVTTVISYFTANWGAIAILLGFGVGYRLFRGLLNHGLRGRV